MCAVNQFFKMLKVSIFLVIIYPKLINNFIFRGEVRRLINVTEILPCFVNISERYYKNTNFLFISEEIHKIDSFHLLLESFSGTVSIQQKNKLGGKFGFFVLFPEQNTSYEVFLNNIMPFTYNRFLILWPNLITNDSAIHGFVSQFWKYKLLNVAILSRNSNESFDIHTYQPYSESYCNRPGPLDLLDVWNITQQNFHRGNDLFPLTKKLKNLNGCKLVCFAKTRPPDAIVREDEDHTWRLEGIGGKLMEEIRKRINFTPVIKVPKLNVSVDKYGYDISHGFPELVTKMLNNFTVDLGFGIYSHIIYDNPEVEFAMTTVSECYGWAVPAHGGKIIPVWMYYTQEFSLAGWFSILVVFTFCSVVFYLTMNTFYSPPGVFRTCSYAIFYVFSLHLGVSASPRVKWLRIRVLISVIILYSLIISSAYQSSLGSFLTVPWQRENIKTFQEILSGSYNIIGIPQGKRILQRFSADNKVLKTLSNRFQVHREHFDSVVLRIQQHKDTATFGAQRFIQFYISNELNGSSRDDIYFLPQCVIQAHASPFLFKKGSPFIKPIDKIISAAVESGLTNFWFTYSTPKISRTLAVIFPLTLQQLKCAFVLLFIGNCLAFSVFLWEIKQSRGR